MKLRCECGELIPDQTDSLSYKAHFLPDQDWFVVFDAIDRIVADAAEGRMKVDDAQTMVRRIQLKASRTMYQCRQCGRLLVNDAQNQLRIFEACSDTDSKQILRSHGGAP